MAEDNHQEQNTTTNEQAIPFQQWSSHIPPDLKDKGYWEPLKDQPLSTVLKNYGHAQERMGKAIVLPDKPEDKEGWEKVYNKLGRPEKPEQYDYTLPEHEHIKWDKDTFGEFNKVIHSLGINKQQAKGLVEWFTKDVITKNEKAYESVKEKAEKVLGEVKKEYGSHADAKLALARRAAEMYLGPEVGKDFIDRNMYDDKLVKGFIKLGTQLAEDGVFGKKPLEFEGVVSRDEAKRQINEIMSDRNHPYWGNPSNPATQEALKRVEELHKIAYPE